MRILGIVPCRAGSKRLPGKSLLQIDGVPLWEHAVNQADELEIPVLVTTDIPEILDVYEGERWVERRRENLCGDRVPIEKVVSEVLERHTGYDAIVLLNPTHPLRLVEDVKLCLHALEDFPSCTGVRKDWGYTIDEGARYACLNEQVRVPRLVVTGGIYAVRVPAFLEKRKLMITGNITRGTYHIERGPHADINTYEDYVVAKALWADRKDPLRPVFT